MESNFVDLVKFINDHNKSSGDSLDISYDIKYATHHNFIGRPLPGYNANKPIVSIEIAKRLLMIEKELNKNGFGLKVYEGYRPVRAGDYMLAWASDEQDQITKKEFYNHINKKDIHEKGYLAKRSKHSSGSAIDLTIIDKSKSAKSPLIYKPGDPLYDGATTPHAKRIYDDNLDFGTSFDCFHEKSHTHSDEINSIARSNRAMLLAIMTKYGFRNYDKEWWHFELINESFKGQFFDFEID